MSLPLPIPNLGVGVWIVHDKRLLIGRRLVEHGCGLWSIPGGKLEPNETIEACARREIEEEVGLRLKNLSFYAVTYDLFPEMGLAYITTHVRAETDDPNFTNREPTKHEDWRWVKANEMPSPLFLPMSNVLRVQKLPEGM